MRKPAAPRLAFGRAENSTPRPDSVLYAASMSSTRKRTRHEPADRTRRSRDLPDRRVRARAAPRRSRIGPAVGDQRRRHVEHLACRSGSRAASPSRTRGRTTSRVVHSLPPCRDPAVGTAIIRSSFCVVDRLVYNSPMLGGTAKARLMRTAIRARRFTIVANNNRVSMSAKKTKKRPRTPRRRSRSKATQYVYAFGKKTDGGSEMRDLLGGKGANLAEMAAIGLPVPPGFTISTDVCTLFLRQQSALSGVAARRCRRGDRRRRTPAKQTLRRPRQSVVVVGALRRARVDARHDGHDSQPRSE